MKDKVNKGTVWVIIKQYFFTSSIVEVWETEPPAEYLKQLESEYSEQLELDCSIILYAEEIDFYGIGGDK